MDKAISNTHPSNSSSQLCVAIESQDEIALSAARFSVDPMVNTKLQKLIRNQVEELYAAKKKSSTIQNRVFKRLVSLIDALRDKKDLGTESLLLELFDSRAKIARAQGKEPKHDVNAAIMQAMASSTEVAADEMLAKLEEYSVDTFYWATILAIRFCPKQKVFEAFQEWVAPTPKTPKRKSAKAKGETVVELLDIYQSGVLYTPGYAPKLVDTNDPNHTERVLPAERLDPRWLDIAINIENLELIKSLTHPGHRPTQDWAERQLSHAINNKQKSKVRPSKFVGLIIASDHPQMLDLYDEAIKYFLKKKDTWEVAICLEMIPQLPQLAIPRLEAMILPSELAEMRESLVNQLKHNA